MRKALLILILLLVVACGQKELVDMQPVEPTTPEPAPVEPVEEVTEPAPAEPINPDKLSLEYRKSENLYDYGSNQDPQYIELAKAHCKDHDGVFNQCGSACAPGQFCAAVCVLTCDVSDKKTKHTVKIENLRFGPKLLTVNKGDTIEFVNMDDVSHTATADGGYFSSPLLGKGQSWMITMKEAGSFQYHSSPYKVAKGEIYVKE